jgi:CRISPR system Cascade subunit CasB
MTPTKTALERLERQIEFLENLHRRIKDDNGAKALLKRALSGEERHIRNTYSIVLSLIPDIEWHQEFWILVACLSVYYPQPFNREHQRNFGYSCRGLANSTNSEGADRRFRALLNTAQEDLQSPLTALIRQIKTKEIGLDYPQLLSDLCKWEHPDQRVQDRWARSFWGAPSQDDQPLETTQFSEDSFTQA